MPKQKTSVAQLANEANIDTDEALVTLWEYGFKNLMAPTDYLNQGDINRARRALGIATRRELKKAKYWMELFHLSEAELNIHLAELGIKPLSTGGGLPQKAISRLKASARKKGLDPITGIILERPETSITVEIEQIVSGIPFNFEPIGHEREIRYLSTSEIIGIHETLVNDFMNTSDPIDPPGVKSIALLESARHRPVTSLGESMKYTTIESAAAALLHSMVLNHPFHNGN